MPFNKKDIKEIMNKKITSKDATMFLHCMNCLDPFLAGKVPESGTMSPKDYNQLEVGSVPFTYPDGTTSTIIGVFCKRCGKQVWSSRHLTQLF